MGSAAHATETSAAKGGAKTKKMDCVKPGKWMLLSKCSQRQTSCQPFLSPAKGLHRLFTSTKRARNKPPDLPGQVCRRAPNAPRHAPFQLSNATLLLLNLASQRLALFASAHQTLQQLLRRLRVAPQVLVARHPR